MVNGRKWLSISVGVLGIVLAGTVATAAASVVVTANASQTGNDKRFTYTVRPESDDTVKDLHIQVAHVDSNGNLAWGDKNSANYDDFDQPAGWMGQLVERVNADGSKDYFVSYWSATKLSAQNHNFRFDHSGNAESDSARVFVTNDGNSLPGAGNVENSYNLTGPYAAISGVPAVGDVARVLIAVGLVTGAWFLMRRGR